ncbi:MAG: hypothetical protein JJT76_11175 [Clostridiaceae bacterium]|nr:hypothetical protein [Clostridiaceae bacterium]
MEDLNEWQQNQYNPGHYIVTGRVPRHISSLTKHPSLMIIAGLIGLLFPIAIVLLTDTPITDLLFLFFLPAIFIIGGILRVKDKQTEICCKTICKTANALGLQDISCFVLHFVLQIVLMNNIVFKR